MRNEIRELNSNELESVSGGGRVEVTREQFEVLLATHSTTSSTPDTATIAKGGVIGTCPK